MYESDAYLLVKTRRDGIYLFNFDDGTFRAVTSYEFVPLYWGVFMFKPMTQGHWVAPLETRNLNEFRVTAPGGRIPVVNF
jgi:hypothetical protein